MKYVTSFLVATSAWWNSFCEQNIIGTSLEDKIIQQNLKPSPAHEKWLIESYRSTAVRLFFGNESRGDAANLEYWGDEMRAYGIGLDVVEEYGHLERNGHRRPR